ncbi:MAG TPA: kelch repeat-containing protein [Chthonomonadaceae bacterium]|nr:kelch repeat-containing protein [Chthonomonadaceae bacterium]
MRLVWRAAIALALGCGAPAGGLAQGAWSAVAPMATPRDAHAALLLPSGPLGGTVLLIGGRTVVQGATTAATESYAAAETCFVPAGEMAGSRSFCPPVLLDNGRVLACGGYQQIGERGGTIRSALLWDPAARTWSATGRMADARELHTATKLGGGSVVAAGGFSDGRILASAEVYDPATGSWSATGAMRTARFGHAALLVGGALFIIGGRTEKDVSLAETERYDAAAGAWSLGPPMRQDRFRHTATLLRDGRVLITGGYSSVQGKTLATAEIFAPDTNTFTLLESTMGDGRMDHTATLLADGRVLIAGGWSSTRNSTVASADIFDPSTNRFTPAAPLPTSRHEHTATLLPDGSVLVAGGLQYEPGLKQTLTDAWLFRE